MNQRQDLNDCVPIVYNGKPAEEWYSLYCQAAMDNDRLVAALKAIINHQNLMGGSMAKMSTTRMIAEGALEQLSRNA